MNEVDIQTIEENGKRYYLTPEGKFPSITTVLGHFENPKFDSWRSFIGEDKANKITKRAASKGTQYHNLVEKYLRNEPYDLGSVSPWVSQMFKRVLPDLQRISNIRGIELPLYSSKLGVAGRCDLVADWDGIPSIIDHKGSRSIKDESKILHYFQQATGYSIMYNHRYNEVIPQIVILMVPDGHSKPLVFVKQAQDYVISLKQKIKEYYAVHQL